MKKISYKRTVTNILVSTIMLSGIGMSVILSEDGQQTVYAAEQTIVQPKEGSLTLQKNDSLNHELPVMGAKFRAYKVMDFTEGAIGANYTINEKFEAFFTAGNGGANLTPSDISGLSTSALDGLINKLTKYAEDTQNGAKFIEAVSDKTGKVIFDPFGLGLGYYLVVETEAPSGYVIDTKSFLVSVPETDKQDLNKWNYDINVELKNSPNSIIKEVNGGHKDVVEVGDILNYNITSPIIVYPENAKFTRYAIKDTMSVGLDFNKDSITTEVSSDGTNYVPYTGKSDLVLKGQDVPAAYLKPGAAVGSEKETKTFGVYFDYNDIKEFKMVRVNYTATLNKDAVIGVDGNTNTAIFEYTTDPDGETDYEIENSPEDKTIVGLTGIDLLKIDGKDAEKSLKGAEFTLFKEDGTTVVQLFKFDDAGELVTENGGNPTVTGDDGKASIYGLKEGIYQLTETKAPEGYQLLAKPIKIEVKDVSTDDKVIEFEVSINDKKVDIVNDKGLIQLDVPNNAGFTLPKTGGIGTALLSIVGLALASVGGVAFIRTKKKEA